jgi:hypothetical protein
VKQKLIHIFQLGIALLIGGLVMTVYIQHRELTQARVNSHVDWSPIGIPSPAVAPTPDPPGLNPYRWPR